MPNMGQDTSVVFEKGLDAARSGKYRDALNAWLPLAKDGQPLAQLNVGVLFVSGLLGEKDIEAALEWFDRASKSGIPEIAEAVELVEKLDDINTFRKMLVFG